MNTKKVLGVSSICALVSACGSGLPTNQTTQASTGIPALTLQVDQYNIGNWLDVNPHDVLNYNCDNATTTFKFRLLNNGTGNLASSGGAVVSFNQTTHGTAFAFGVTQPVMPVAASSDQEFNISLSGGTDCEHLTGNGGGFYGQEDALITIHTNDPTNPTFEATLQVLGHS